MRTSTLSLAIIVLGIFLLLLFSGCRGGDTHSPQADHSQEPDEQITPDTPTRGAQIMAFQFRPDSVLESGVKEIQGHIDVSIFASQETPGYAVVEVRGSPVDLLREDQEIRSVSFPAALRLQDGRMIVVGMWSSVTGTTANCSMLRALSLSTEIEADRVNSAVLQLMRRTTTEGCSNQALSPVERTASAGPQARPGNNLEVVLRMGRDWEIHIPDMDDDGVLDKDDNCPSVPNPGQENMDHDIMGDACDTDDDNDGVLDEHDNCPAEYNPPMDASGTQADADGDGIGDACDPETEVEGPVDQDLDGVPDNLDNCPDKRNTSQSDNDWDGIGDACDSDDDNDGVPDRRDNCPRHYNPNQDRTACIDTDGDGVMNSNDNCPSDPNADQADADRDGSGDECDADDDNDSIPDGADPCPLVPQSAEDCDGVDNDCDGQVDEDLVPPPADLQHGVCAGMLRVCQWGSWMEPDYETIAEYEVEEASCDGIDNDCDGQVDESGTAITASASLTTAREAGDVTNPNRGMAAPWYVKLYKDGAGKNAFSVDVNCDSDIDTDGDGEIDTTFDKVWRLDTDGDTPGITITEDEDEDGVTRAEPVWSHLKQAFESCYSNGYSLVDLQFSLERFITHSFEHNGHDCTMEHANALGKKMGFAIPMEGPRGYARQYDDGEAHVSDTRDNYCTCALEGDCSNFDYQPTGSYVTYPVDPTEFVKWIALMQSVLSAAEGTGIKFRLYFTYPSYDIDKEHLLCDPEDPDPDDPFCDLVGHLTTIRNWLFKPAAESSDCLSSGGIPVCESDFSHLVSTMYPLFLDEWVYAYLHWQSDWVRSPDGEANRNRLLNTLMEMLQNKKKILVRQIMFKDDYFDTNDLVWAEATEATDLACSHDNPGAAYDDCPYLDDWPGVDPQAAGEADLSFCADGNETETACKRLLLGHWVAGFMTRDSVGPRWPDADVETALEKYIPFSENDTMYVPMEGEPGVWFPNAFGRHCANEDGEGDPGICGQDTFNYIPRLTEDGEVLLLSLSYDCTDTTVFIKDPETPPELQNTPSHYFLDSNAVIRYYLRTEAAKKETVYSWGYNAFGQLGNNSTSNSEAPVPGDTATQVKQIAAGGSHSLALHADGSVSAWGSNSNGQLGNGVVGGNSAVTVLVSELEGVLETVYEDPLEGVSAIAAGENHSLALLEDKTVVAWGSNSSGQLGNEDVAVGGNSAVPVLVSELEEDLGEVLVLEEPLQGVLAIAAGANHSLALLEDKTVVAWGSNSNGQLGNGSTADSATPVSVSGLTGVSAIAAGANHSLALLTDGTMMAWGSNSNGQLGNGSTDDSPTPVPVSGLVGVAAIDAGANHSLALLTDGTVMGWGSNSNGQLGNGSTDDSSMPVSVNCNSEQSYCDQGGVLHDVLTIAAGGDHSMAVRDMNSDDNNLPSRYWIYVWGKDYYKDPNCVGDTSDVVVSTSVQKASYRGLCINSNGTLTGIRNQKYSNKNTPLSIAAGQEHMMYLMWGGEGQPCYLGPSVPINDVDVNEHTCATDGNSLYCTTLEDGSTTCDYSKFTCIQPGETDASGLWPICVPKYHCLPDAEGIHKWLARFHWSSLKHQRNTLYYRQFFMNYLMNYSEEFWNSLLKVFGYRFGLHAARDGDNDRKLNFTITNLGAAAPFYDRQLYIVLGQEISGSVDKVGNPYEIVSFDDGSALDLRLVQPGCNWYDREDDGSCSVSEQGISFSVEFTDETIAAMSPDNNEDLTPDLGCYRLGLWLPDPDEGLREQGKYAIRFANSDMIWDSDEGVNWLNEDSNLAIGCSCDEGNT